MRLGLFFFMAKNYTGYELSRAWFDFAFENPEKITPNHTALFFFAIEHCNRLGWKEKFGFPMEMAKNAIGIKNYRTYANTFNDLIEWGFFIIHQKSQNQWSANIIALAKNTQANAKANTIAPTKALDKAIQKHSQKQRIGSVGIDKQIQNNTVTINNTETIHHNFISAKEIFSQPYSTHTEHFQTEHTEKEYTQFQNFLNAIFRDFTIEQLSSQWDRCIGIGDWKKVLKGKGYMVIKPALEKAIAAKEGNRNQMGLRIKTFTNGLFDEKVLMT